MARIEKETNELERFRIGSRFPSKKNNVFKIDLNGKICVAKIYSEEFKDRIGIEYKILQMCDSKDIPAPKPIEIRKNAIIMSYIDGENAGDIFDSLSDYGSANADHLLDGIAAWLAKFHKAYDSRCARGDSILRNFILFGDRVFGLDFEEFSESDSLIDIGQTCAYMLSMQPKFTHEKFAIAIDFSRKYWHYSGFDRSGELPRFVADGLRHYARFRKDGELLIDWARKIEKNGLKSQ